MTNCFLAKKVQEGAPAAKNSRNRRSSTTAASEGEGSDGCNQADSSGRVGAHCTIEQAHAQGLLQVDIEGLEGCVLRLEALVAVDRLGRLDAAGQTARVVGHHSDFLVDAEGRVLNRLLLGQQTRAIGSHSSHELHG